MKRVTLVIAATLLVSLADVGSASAEDGFFSRLNPLRWFRSASADVAHDQRQLEIRSKLRERGIDPDLIDQRIARMSSGQESGARPGSKNGQGRPDRSVDRRTDGVKQHGLSEDYIDARVARAIDMRTKAVDRTDGYRPPPVHWIEDSVPADNAGDSTIRNSGYLGPPEQVSRSSQSIGGGKRWTRGR